MLKDNHIAAGGGILSAVAKVRANIPHTVKIEVEVEDMEMVQMHYMSGNADFGRESATIDNISLYRENEESAGIKAYVFLPDVLMVENLRYHAAVGGKHISAQLGVDGNVAHASRNENLFKCFAYAVILLYFLQHIPVWVFCGKI